tara:strand:+ start:805 stop:924 length:120 start_codon:yes stop_codon:yes gene_type:complete
MIIARELGGLECSEQDDVVVVIDPPEEKSQTIETSLLRK